MSARNRRAGIHAAVFLTTLVGGLLAAPFVSAGSAPDIDFNQFMNDTMKQTPDPDRITMVWWLPEELWLLSFAQDDSMTDEDVEEFLTVLRPYVLLAVVDGTLGPFGGATFVAPETVRESVVLVDAAGQRSKPLGNEEVSPDARNLAAMMTPVITSMAGPIGENMTFLFFHAKDSDGNPKIGATMKGRFSVEVGDQHFAWKTPLGSVLPPKVCPVDGEELSGAWTYCPYHGKELVDKASEPKAE